MSVSRPPAIALRAPLRALTRRQGRSRRRGRSVLARGGRSSRGRALSATGRRRIAVAVLVLALAAGGWVWLRDSPLVAVDDVTVRGLSGGPEAAAVRNALVAAARDMSTLHVRPERLRSAVSPYPAVRDISVTTDFPHGMRIDVVEHDPVAAVELDGRRVPVAADGTLLRGRPAPAQLVTLSIPSANGGGRLTSPRARAAVAVVGSAPRDLRPFVSDVGFGPEGLRVSMRNGPTLQLGDAGRARAKWIAAGRVLGDPRSAGASYLDVRVPERPVAGRFPDTQGQVELP